ncbi:MAG: hypothetical protein J2P36_15955, partial [Ktedonobacteraceae bacterium]|nr:hypothetical protein [Ktedonobacteraceae bacterium]
MEHIIHGLLKSRKRESCFLRGFAASSLGLTRSKILKRLVFFLGEWASVVACRLNGHLPGQKRYT